MDTKSFVMGYAVGYNDGLDDSGGEPSEEWQPPDDWLEVPEPGAWEACFLIEPKQRLSFKLTFYGYEDKYRSYCGNVTIDWGDGTVETYEGNTNIGGDGYPIWTPESKRRPSEITHNYAEAGQYVVKATVDEYCSLLGGASDGNGYYYANLLIAKLGKNIRLKAADDNLTFGGGFANNYRLCWVVINGSSEMCSTIFSSCKGLMRIDFAEPLVNLWQNAFGAARVPKIDFSHIERIDGYVFSGATILQENISLPECTEIGGNSFSGTLIKNISAPNCTSVGNDAFYNCNALEYAEFAENCTFGSDCFDDCFSLYPRPDGSIN